jgi:hypothetical protein
MAGKTKNLLGNLTRSRENDQELKDNSTENKGATIPSNESNQPSEQAPPLEKQSSDLKVESKKDDAPMDVIEPKATLVAQEATENKKAESISIRISKSEMKLVGSLVRHKRMVGYTNYTKKEAISEAIAMLRDKYPEVLKND